MKIQSSEMSKEGKASVRGGGVRQGSQGGGGSGLGAPHVN